MKSVMMQLCFYVLGLSSCVLHTVMYLMLFGRVAVQVAAKLYGCHG